MHARLISIATVVTAMVLTAGCDQSTGDDIDPSFRRGDDGGDDGGDIGILTTQSIGGFKGNGCPDPTAVAVETWLGDDGWYVVPEGAADNARYAARLNADQALIGQFLAQEGVEDYCSTACDEAGSAWEGGAVVEESGHSFGEVLIVGECPGGGLQTAVDVSAEGTVGCACAG